MALHEANSVANSDSQHVALNSDPSHRFICCIDMAIREDAFNLRLLKELCTMATAVGMPPGGGENGPSGWNSSTAAAKAAIALSGDGTEVLAKNKQLADLALSLKSMPCQHKLSHSLLLRLEACVTERRLPQV